MLAGLAALESMTTNIILLAFRSMDAELGSSVKNLSATLGATGNGMKSPKPWLGVCCSSNAAKSK